LKRSRFVNLRMDDELFDTLEEYSKENIMSFSEALRHVAQIGLKIDEIDLPKMSEEELKELTKDLDKKIKDETFFEWIDSKTPYQQKAIKNWIIIQEEKRNKTRF